MQRALLRLPAESFSVLAAEPFDLTAVSSLERSVIVATDYGGLLPSADENEFARREPRIAQSGRMRKANQTWRISEIGGLLALAVSRIRARKASQLSEHGGDSSLDNLGVQSGHPTASKRRTADA